MKKQWNIPRIWEGSRCFIIGGGPSMAEQFAIPQGVVDAVRRKESDIAAYSPYLSSIHSEKVIGVNMAYQLGSWVDVCFFGDYGFWKKQHVGLKDYKGLCVSCVKEVQAPWVKYVTKNRQHDFGITYKNGSISWNKNSGGAAINLAVHLGVKEIVLIGFDMSLDTAKNQHWHKAYKTNPRTVRGTMRMHLRGFPAIAHDLKKTGVIILNASPNSRIQEFPKINIKDLFPNLQTG